MIVIISSAKTMKLRSFNQAVTHSSIALTEEYDIMRLNLKELTKADIMRLMSVSEKIAEENHARHKKLAKNITENNGRPAITTYFGEVFRQLEVEKYSTKQIHFVQKHLRVISGLYGLVKPLDLIQEYRLEMATKLAHSKRNNLYDFWREPITKELKDQLTNSKHKFLINLASEEYSSAVDVKTLGFPMINIGFKTMKHGKPSSLGMAVKIARGKMVNFIIKEGVDSPESLKDFNIDGYIFAKNLSDSSNFLFIN